MDLATAISVSLLHLMLLCLIIYLLDFYLLIVIFLLKREGNF